MKDYYKINEISKLYGIGVDSLRYYERIGILKPKRDINGYRLYSLKDIYKLNIISDLRQLDFSMKQIKEYLDHQSIDNTIALLYEEQEYVKEQLKKLRERKQIMKDRIEALKSAASITAGEYVVKELPPRPCVRLNEYITRDEEMDFAVKKLHRKHENKIRDFGNQSIGAVMSLEDLEKGLVNVYRSIFFILERTEENYDFMLPEGRYLSCCYRGDYLQSTERISKMIAYSKSQGFNISGDPFEIYVVDNRETMKEEEFLTEIQIQILESV
jgi:DNA-binding transcriptional MerR regulator